MSAISTGSAIKGMRYLPVFLLIGVILYFVMQAVIGGVFGVDSRRHLAQALSTCYFRPEGQEQNAARGSKPQRVRLAADSNRVVLNCVVAV